jgi:hypothetical protein
MNTKVESDARVFRGARKRSARSVDLRSCTIPYERMVSTWGGGISIFQGSVAFRQPDDYAGNVANDVHLAHTHLYGFVENESAGTVPPVTLANESHFGRLYSLRQRCRIGLDYRGVAKPWPSAVGGQPHVVEA